MSSTPLVDSVESIIANYNGDRLTIDYIIQAIKDSGIETDEESIRDAAFHALSIDSEVDEHTEATLTLPPGFEVFSKVVESSLNTARKAYKIIHDEVGMTTKEFKSLNKMIDSEILVNTFRLIMRGDDAETRRQLLVVKNYLLYTIKPHLSDIIIQDADKEEKYKKKKTLGKKLNAIYSDLFKAKKELVKRYAGIPAESLIKLNAPYFACLAAYAKNKLIPLEDAELTELFATFNKVDITFQNQFRRLNPLERILFIIQLNDRFNFSVFVEEAFTTSPNFYIPTLLSNFYRKVKRVFYNGCDALESDVEMAIENVKLNFNAFNLYTPEDAFKDIRRHLRSLYSCQNVAFVDEKIRSAISDMFGGAEGEAALEIAFNKQLELLESKVYSNPAYELLVSQIGDDVIEELIRLANLNEEVDLNAIDNLISEGVSEDYYTKKYDISPLMFLGGDVTSSALQELRNTFSNIVDRKSILDIRKTLISRFGDLKDSKLYDEMMSFIEERFRTGRVTKKVYDFFNYFASVYGDLSLIPSNAKNFGVLRLSKISDMPKSVQKSVADQIKTYVNSLTTEIAISRLVSTARLKVATKIQLALNRKPVDVELIAGLLSDLELEENVQEQIIQEIKNKKFDNIYRVLAVATKRTQALKDPLTYTGAKRAQRERANANKNAVQRVLESQPPVSPYLKLCMTWHTLKPWMNLPIHFKYYIQHPQNKSKSEMTKSEKHNYGKRLNLGSEADYYYMPSNSFWIHYCKTYFANKQCNLSALVNTFDSPAKKHIMGVYDSSVANPTLRRLVKADFEAECNWFAANEIEPIKRTAEWYESTLKGKELEAAMKIAVRKTASVIGKDAKKEEAGVIVKAIAKQVNQEKGLSIYNFFFGVESFLYFLDSSSPVANFAIYFKDLFATTAKAGLERLAAKTPAQMFPEQLLLSAGSRAEFEELFKIYVDEKTQADCIELWANSHPFDKAIKPIEGESFILSSRTTKVLAPLIGKSLINVCSNSADMNGLEPELVYEDNGVLKCLGSQDVARIVAGDYNLPVPESVVEEIKLMYSYRENDIDVVLTRIQKKVEEFVANNFEGVYREISEHDRLTNGEILTEENVVAEDYPALQRLIQTIKDISEMSSSAQSISIDLSLGHAATYARKLYKITLENLISQYVQFNHQLHLDLKAEAKRRMARYADISQARADKNERVMMLSGLYAFIENSLPVTLSLQDKEDIVDSVTVMIKLPESQVTRPENDVCEVCGQATQYRTYACQTNSQGFSTYCVRVCGACLDKTVDRNFKLPSKKVLQEVEIQEIAYDFLRYQNTYDTLAEALRSNGVDFNPLVNTINNLWGEWLKRRWLFDEESLQHKRHALVKLLDHYDIPVSDPLSVAYTTLMNNPEFMKVYSAVVDRYYGEGIRLAEPFISVEMKRPFVDGCPVSTYEALEFVNTVASSFVLKPTSFDLSRNLIAPFYSKFKVCQPPSAEAFKEVRRIDGLLNFLQEIQMMTTQKQSQMNRSGVMTIQGVMDYLIDAAIGKLNPAAYERVEKTAESLNMSVRRMFYTRIMQQRIIPAIETLEKHAQVKIGGAVEGDTSARKFNEILRVLAIPYVAGESPVNNLLRKYKVDWSHLVGVVNISKMMIYRMAHAFLERVKHLAELAQEAKAKDVYSVVDKRRAGKKGGRKIFKEAKKASEKKPLSWAEAGDDDEFEQLGIFEDEDEVEQLADDVVDEVQVMPTRVADADFDVFASQTVKKTISRPELVILQNNINNKLALFDIPELAIIQSDKGSEEMAQLIEEIDGVAADDQPATGFVESELREIEDAAPLEQEYQAIDLSEFNLDEIPNYEEMLEQQFDNEGEEESKEADYGDEGEYEEEGEELL